MTNYPAACTRRATPTPAIDRPANRRSLAALLHVRADEVLGIGFQHIVDLVEDVVRLRRQLLPAFLAGTTGRVSGLVAVVPATLPRCLFLGHLSYSDLSDHEIRAIPATAALTTTPTWTDRSRGPCPALAESVMNNPHWSLTATLLIGTDSPVSYSPTPPHRCTEPIDGSTSGSARRPAPWRPLRHPAARRRAPWCP